MRKLYCTVILLLSLLPRQIAAAEYTEQFTGASGDPVSGWTTFGTDDTFSASSFKYDITGTSGKVADLTGANEDHGAYFNTIDSLAYSTLELLVKFKINVFPVGGTMLGPVLGMSWDTGCNLGITVGISDTDVSLHEWRGYDVDLEACADRFADSGVKTAGFLSDDTWYISRIRVDSTTAKLKTWKPDTQSEPVSWDISYTLTVARPVGHTGIIIDPLTDLSKFMTVDWFVATTAGETATNPDDVAPPASGRRVMVVN